MEEKGPVVEQIRDKVEEVSGEKYVAEFEELLEDVCKRMTKISLKVHDNENLPTHLQGYRNKVSAFAIDIRLGVRSKRRGQGWTTPK